MNTYPRSRYATVLGRDLHYMEWGASSSPVLVMWHGFARTGRDFEVSAEHLAANWRVLCPDTIGCGLSEWSPEPDTEYNVHNYARLAAGLLDTLGVERCAWVGTSMGGHVGMIASAGPLRGRISRMVLNDVGPDTPAGEMKRIADYMSRPPTFGTVREAERWMRTQYAAMGAMTDEQWLWRAETSLRRLTDGKFTLHYDPRITAELVNRRPDFNLWDEWDRGSCPVLLLRGVNSKVLTEDTTERMTHRGPALRVERLEGCGHPPALNTPERIRLISDFIAG